MGMASSDDEEQIFEDHELLEWARQTPKSPRSYDNPNPTEDELAFHEEEKRRWLEKKPKTRNPYRNDKR
ncbi:MAG: hypothetical protein A2651_01015 [Candidatus Yanofskybacteria bacterium RIFCSPHIGHO2_01_FULL_42_12]|nr:MAG: hypothetical protein A2651_01015 [Candidatus Yanofskybacteria bacterium RIFCSPHIGHO2_01_FULL_42_12]